MNGVLIIDKPAGLTSHDVVNRVRRLLRERSVGHLGTLDPLATGVLPLVAGRMTRLAQFYTQSEKTYEGAIRFEFIGQGGKRIGLLDQLGELPPPFRREEEIPKRIETLPLAGLAKLVLCVERLADNASSRCPRC